MEGKQKRLGLVQLAVLVVVVVAVEVLAEVRTTRKQG